jgi:uncharacterized membrane protein YgcG
VFLVLSICAAAAATADERIHNYHSDILVRADGWIEVTETITVRAEGNQIRRGIYRDYPVRYQDRLGNDVEVIYEPRSVLRDGRPEDFHMEDSGDSVRTYFGSADRLLSPGTYTYTYRYDAGRMLGFFDNIDELYWNVTGFDWSFPIDQASASVTFAFDVPAESLVLVAYTGSFGQRGDDYSAAVDPGGVAQFRTTRGLSLHEGITIAVGWPKGFVKEPSDVQKFIWLLSDNLNFLVILAGFVAMLSYYIPVWRRYGRDPDPGVVFTRYEPPEGFSPASLRYIDNMAYDNEVMTAAIVSLAVKGYLRIDNDGDTHVLLRQRPAKPAPEMATGERELHDALFRGRDRVELIDENHAIVSAARKAHERSLKRDYHQRYFKTNGLLNLPPLLVGSISSLIAFAIGPGLLVFVTAVAMVLTMVVFLFIMRQPTALGRSLMDDAAGFREYLEIAEKDEMNLRNPPEKTPELFERYLPFALALGVDQKWAKRFAAIFASLKGPNDSEWRPTWYNGSWSSFNLSSTTSSLSSGLSSAISSSVSPPGSSSGSGGGGFSGGGGGGGGGGGW